ncbi:MAG: hypothetical protein AAGI24_14780 [Pseudomonadota bacterium]
MAISAVAEHHFPCATGRAPLAVHHTTGIMEQVLHLSGGNTLLHCNHTLGEA